MSGLACGVDTTGWPSRPPVAAQSVAAPGAAPNGAAVEDGLVARGRALFFDRGLSHDGRMACASCHDPARGFTDGRASPRARGVALALPRTPSLLDAGRTAGPFFWNGRAGSLQAQAFWPLYAPAELGATDETLAPHGGAQIVARSLAAFIGTLSTPPAPYDRFVAGDCAQLPPLEREGARLVLQEKGCISCHSGPELRGGSTVMLRYSDVPAVQFRDAESSYSADAGLAAVPDGGHVTLASVPQTLRNLAFRGPPWGRFGSEATLADFLDRHGMQPLDASKRTRFSGAEKQRVLAFLLVGLRSPVRGDPWKAPAPFPP